MALPNAGGARSRKLDARVAVQTAPAAGDSAKQDAFGAVDQSQWITTKTVWCGLEVLTGDEAAIGGQATARRQFRVTVRRQPGITTKHRLKVLTGRYKGAELAPQTFGGDPRGEFLEVICEATGES